MADILAAEVRTVAWGVTNRAPDWDTFTGTVKRALVT